MDRLTPEQRFQIVQFYFENNGRFSKENFVLAMKLKLLVEWLRQQTKLPHLEEANPQVYVETPLHPEKLTVWCALWAGGILLQNR
ncbi:hypothetical protein TNCV_1644681 [Trichonephila clavipes]|nr:hypothetical protein TNCV_1644681 [Trichonephila clavipes]